MKAYLKGVLRNAGISSNSFRSVGKISEEKGNCRLDSEKCERQGDNQQGLNKEFFIYEALRDYARDLNRETCAYKFVAKKRKKRI